MVANRNVKTSTLTLGTASGSTVVTHTLASNETAAVPHKFSILPRSDPGTAFRWWVSANNATTYTFGWAGANAGVQLDVTAALIPTVCGGSATVTGW
jgi:hypothetical protein